MNSISLRFTSVVYRLGVRMNSNLSYESAVCKLNLLQSNQSVINQIRKKLKTGVERCKNIEEMQNYLKRTGVPMSKLDQLSVIHVAGTKGKGSTSAMCESILRHHGFRTGFYSSPHLVAVRERIRLDGKVVSEATFAKYFHRVYDMLDATKLHEGDMPGYFAFLTVLAFNTFLAEKVDVAIVEVGIGGIVDYTNVLRKVAVVGITALGLDHTGILGGTLPQIAAAKAGVLKAGCRAHSAPQPPAALRVLRAVAGDLKCPLTIAPDFDSYSFAGGRKTLQLQCDVDAYKTNASLAIQLAHSWMRHNKSANGHNIKRNGTKGGTKNGTYISNGDRNDRDVLLNDNNEVTNDRDVLLNRNNVTNDRDVSLNRSNNVTNNSDVSLNRNNDVTNDGEVLLNGNGVLEGEVWADTLEVPLETWLGLQRCRWPGRYHVVEAAAARCYLDGAHTKESMDICAEWFRRNALSDNKMLIFSATGDRDAAVLLRPLATISFKRVYFVTPTAYKATAVNKDDYSTVEQKDMLARCESHEKIWQGMNRSDTVVCECVDDALSSIKGEAQKPAVLVTGSLHLVGAALCILDPDLTTYS